MISITRPIAPFWRSARHFASAAALVFAFLVPNLAFGQDGARIVSINIEYVGTPTVDESRIYANMVTKVGDRLTPDTSQENIRTLWASGIVENVQIYKNSAPGGVALTVRVKTRGILGGVYFEGAEVFDYDRLRRLSGLSLGSPIDDFQLREGRDSILERYRSKYYPDVQVSYRTAQDPETGFTQAVYTVNEGRRGKLGEITFEGLTTVDSDQLQKEMVTKRKTLYRIFTDAGRVDPDRIEGDQVAIERHLQNAGYLNAEVYDIERQYRDGGKIDLLYRVREGQRYTINRVAIRGMSTFSPSEVTPALELTAGQPYSIDAITADTSMLMAYYGSKGYADARVVAKPEIAGGLLLNVVYEVREGGPITIGRIDIAGNEKTEDMIIRRELAVAPGELYNTVRIDASKRRLENMGYFTPGSIEVSGADGARPGVRDMTVGVHETSTGSLQFGAGFSSIDNLVGFLEVNQSNFDLFDPWGFTGGGQKFQLGLKYGAERRDFQIGLTEPWFLGRRLSFGGELFFRDLFFYSDQYDQRNYGGALFLRKPLGKHAYVRGEYRLQNVEVHSIVDEASPEIAAEAGEFWESQINVAFTHDTRDSIFLARTGHRVTMGTSVTGGFLGGDVNTYGIDFAGTQHFHLPFDTIFKLEVGASVIDGFSSDDAVPIFEREFLGGSNSLRGFRFRDVGPKDLNGEPLGGRTAASFTAEVTYPIIEKVRGAFFYDAGLVNTEEFDFDSEFYNSNWGFGLRLYLPIGPIVLDYGIPMESDAFNDSGGRFNFYIGYEF